MTNELDGAQPWYPDDPETERPADISPDASADAGQPDHEDAPVRPWWQRPINLFGLLATTAICFGLIGWSVGSSQRDAHNDVDIGFLHDMRVHHEQATFMSVLYLSRPNTNPQLQSVAISIMQGQNIEIGRMVQLLRDFGAPEARNNDIAPMQWMTKRGDTSATTMSDMPSDTTTNSPPGDDADRGTALMPGMATEAQLEELNASRGEAADAMFVELMVRHHRGGIDMAEYEVAYGRNDEVKKMANAMSHGQRAEITELNNLVQP